MCPTHSQLLKACFFLAVAAVAALPGCGPRAGDPGFPNQACIGVANYTCSAQDGGVQDGGSK